MTLASVSSLLLALLVAALFSHPCLAHTKPRVDRSPRPIPSPTASPSTDALAFNNGYDHRAHAKPGGPYYVEDTHGVGYAVVTLNGQSSHSHYFNAITGATGKIISYAWFINDGDGKRRILCRRVSCSVRFSIGVTSISLTVVDNTKDTSTGYSKVTVVDGARPGVRIWYYRNEPWAPFKIDEDNIPTLSATRKRVDFFTFNSFPKALKLAARPSSIRVMGYIAFPASGPYRFQLSCGGAVCFVNINNRPILSGDHGVVQTKKPLWFKQGTYTLLILYRRKFPKAKYPSLVLRWKKPLHSKFEIIPSTALTHRPALIHPIIHALRPNPARVGGILVVKGSSFVEIKAVRVGKLHCDGIVSTSQFALKCVVPGVKGDTKLTVVTNAGRSNSVKLVVNGHAKSDSVTPTSSPSPSRKAQSVQKDGGKKNGSSNGKKKETKKTESQKNTQNKKGPTGPVGYYQPVRFRKTYLHQNGTIWKMPQLTSVALGPDGRYYIGSLGGYVHAVTTDLDGTNVLSHCRSEHVGTHRSILGLAFNPAQTRSFVLYATTSVLYWKSKRYLLSVEGWANGEVITMKTHKQRCLVRIRTVLSGLPVSNYDHSVNTVTFDNEGRLLVSIGCTTNAGVSERNDAMGGVPDSPLSGSVVIADVLRRGFNGKMKYSQYTNPGTADVVSGDVKLYATGVRNSFGATMHSNGNLYATDNGANPKYGIQSVGCRQWETTKPAHEKDTLKRIIRGRWYGFANRNRGRWDRAQCIHVRPTLSNETKFYHRNYPTFTRTPGWTKFEPALAIMDASTNGLVEYTANTFGAQLRGDLIATKFAVHSSGETTRIKLDHNNPDKVRATVKVAQHSGIAVAMTGTGGLIMPRVYQGIVAALVPAEWDPKRVVVTSVLPFRGPSRGGNTVTITGWNLWKPAKVKFGSKNCKRARDYSGDGRSLRCTVPSGTKGEKVAVTVEISGRRRSFSYGYEYLYMNV